MPTAGYYFMQHFLATTSQRKLNIPRPTSAILSREEGITLSSSPVLSESGVSCPKLEGKVEWRVGPPRGERREPGKTGQGDHTPTTHSAMPSIAHHCSVTNPSQSLDTTPQVLDTTKLVLSGNQTVSNACRLYYMDSAWNKRARSVHLGELQNESGKQLVLKWVAYIWISFYSCLLFSILCFDFQFLSYSAKVNKCTKCIKQVEIDEKKSFI